MKPLELNLASRPYRNDAPIVAGLVALAVLAVAMTAHNAYTWFTADAQQAALLERLAGHRSEMARMKAEEQRLRKELAAVDAEVLGAQVQFVSSVLAQRNFSWTSLLNSLEDVLPWNVKLISIRPGFEGTGRVRIVLRGMARDLGAFLSFQDVLERSAAFSDVTPGNYSYVARDSRADERIQFDMTCIYEPPPPGTAPPEVQSAANTDAGDAGPSRADELIVVPDEGEGSIATSGRRAAERPAAAAIDAGRRASERAGSGVRGAGERTARGAQRAAAPSRGQGAVPPPAASAGARPRGRAARQDDRGARQDDRAGVVVGAGVAGAPRRGGARAARGAGAADRPETPAARQGARRAGARPTGAGTPPAPATPPELEVPPPPKEIPKEDLVEYDEEGNIVIKFKKAPAAPGGSGAGSGGADGGGSSGGSGGGDGNSGSSSGGGRP